MGIAKFDDGIIDNPKFEKAGAAACWLWFCSVLVSRRGLTDGFISKLKVQTLVPGLPQPYKHAEKLVECGLWDEALGGYQVHDYLEWNPSKVQVEEYRQHDKDRKQSARRQKSVSGVDTARNPNGIQTDSERRGATHAGAKSESESLSKRFGSSGESARGGNSHARHSWCSARICVPMVLHADFTGRLGTRTADTDLLRWYPTVVAKFDGQPLGDDLFAFWRNEFAAWVGTVTQAPSQRRPTAVESNLRGLQEDLSLAASVALLEARRGN
jgi:hypothetical protein